MDHDEFIARPARGERIRLRLLARDYDTAAVRAWARANGIEVARMGGLPRYVYEQYAREQAAGDAG